MVSIQYGGGPTLEQRQAFCNLRTGSHIPGYLGFVPQLKFHNGKTFGKETHDCAHRLQYYHGPRNQTMTQMLPAVGVQNGASKRDPSKEEGLTRRLPMPTGDNKYTEKMMPGYSGDIPRSLNRFGGTYRAICDECVDEFIGDFERNQARQADLVKMASSFPRLRPIEGDPRVRDHMNLWADGLSKSGSALATDRRSLTEPPLPGYTGYVPRLNNTELGLGARYHLATGRSLEVFADENARHFGRLEQDVTVDRTTGSGPLALKVQTEPRCSRRLFNQDGMIPAYTGHMHRSKEEVGSTVGDTTRHLEVCRHDFPSFGDYVRHKDLSLSNR